MRIFSQALIFTVIVLMISCDISAVGAATKDDVLGRGFLRCGVSTGLPGFSSSDERGQWSGFNVEICRAVASAVLGDADKVKYIPLVARERATSLQIGEVDMLSDGITWTFTRDTSLGLHFTGVSYYDGQGFMVWDSLGATALSELDGLDICLQSGTTTELNLRDYFTEKNMSYHPVVFDSPDQVLKGFEAGRCEALTGDKSQLYSLRTRLASSKEAVILPDVIAKEPLGPVVRQGDDAWFNIVKWTLYVMINAEELGVTSANIEEMKKNVKPEVRRLLGLEGIKGEGLGLASDWAYQILRQVGNYGEMFEHTVGKKSALKIERGQNALWLDGGLQYAPPIR